VATTLRERREVAAFGKKGKERKKSAKANEEREKRVRQRKGMEEI